MHEVSVVSSLVNAVIDELAKYKVTKVHSVTAVIGDLTNLGEEQMLSQLSCRYSPQSRPLSAARTQAQR